MYLNHIRTKDLGDGRLALQVIEPEYGVHLFDDTLIKLPFPGHFIHHLYGLLVGETFFIKTFLSESLVDIHAGHEPFLQREVLR